MGGTVSSRPPASPVIILEKPLSKTTPDWKTGELCADPNYGFEEQGKRRKERVMVATEAEMISAKVPPKLRDFCAHHYINFEKCKKDKFPFVYRCHPEKHNYEHCQYEDYLIRMKDYERERRLLHRKLRKEKKNGGRNHDE
ncbi:NADH dehydrogenase [ubiquinone] 1 beta subcomplex subunit 7 [Orchesella cincta]|uniref:NADH dehydrogenase [ubiquinone] 1 beta subcomplex subunit 7 n=1 Tax=Orchesella cincta TaxID=48709 RepID=A0A1D2MFT7_ORCCI|nr:NADH dehydrogenase [ubiquinone] 1 beta subcomplex subunit 7 [Orchesella cincta]